jgi:hypothetical protein
MEKVVRPEQGACRTVLLNCMLSLSVDLARASAGCLALVIPSLISAMATACQVCSLASWQDLRG